MLKLNFKIPKSRQKFVRIVAIFLVWLTIVFVGGGYIADTVRERRRQPLITESVDLIGEGLTDEERTPEQLKNKRAREKLNTLNVAHDLGAIASALGIENWYVIGAETRNNIPSLVPYFPPGQDFSQWREAFVVRIYVDVKIKNPVPFVYDIYYDWITMQLPDIHLSHREDETGTSFSGYSNAGKVFVCGKITTASLDTSVYILQYTIKNDGQADVEKKAKQWQHLLEGLK